MRISRLFPLGFHKRKTLGWQPGKFHFTSTSADSDVSGTRNTVLHAKFIIAILQMGKVSLTQDHTAGDWQREGLDPDPSGSKACELFTILKTSLFAPSFRTSVPYGPKCHFTSFSKQIKKKLDWL